METEVKLATDVEVLKKGVEHASYVATKLDVAIEKLSEVASSLDRMIAVHENRLEHHEQVDRELFSLIEERRKETKEQYETLHKRIGSMRDDFDHELSDSLKALSAEIKELKSHNAEHHNEISRRISGLEKWRYFVMGMAAIGGFIVARYEIMAKMFS
jgi:chromosome segregation ATPase|tara:strand:- start:842 stop:1315 length:474 start_codon:yes stop_codon:yes gene_type:complete